MAHKRIIFVILAVVLLVGLGFLAASCAAGSDDPTQSPGIEVDIDHKKSKKSSSDKGTKKKTTSSSRK